MLALCIVLYHLTAWDVRLPSADSLPGCVGVHGVSMFFVLSGLCIALAYHRSLDSAWTVGRFAVHLIFRIWPTLWLAVFTFTAILAMKGEASGWRLVALNLTTLFGFVKPPAYINAGAWSLNNIMVCCAASVLIVLAFYRSSLTLPHVPAVALALGQLGLATCGVELLHPLVRELARLFLPAAGAAIMAPLTIGVALLVSWRTYHRFECPLMQLAQRVSQSTKAAAHVT